MQVQRLFYFEVCLSMDIVFPWRISHCTYSAGCTRFLTSLTVYFEAINDPNAALNGSQKRLTIR